MSIIFNESEERKDSKTFKRISIDEKGKVPSNLNKMPMNFIPNAGQIDLKVKYYTGGRSFGFYFTKEKVILSFVKESFKRDFNENYSGGKDISENEENEIALAMKFIDANPYAKIEGQMKDGGKVNYFKGNNSEKWCTDLPTYSRVVYKNLWESIDLVFYGANCQLKYKFIVHPGGDYQDIGLSYKGSDDISLDHEGNLLIRNELGVLVDEAPLSYQEIEGRKVLLDSSFVVNKDVKGVYSFEIEKGYNPSYPIIIDRGLMYSSYLGESSNDRGDGIVLDSNGNTYVIDSTSSLKFSNHRGAF